MQLEASPFGTDSQARKRFRLTFRQRTVATAKTHKPADVQHSREPHWTAFGETLIDRFNLPKELVEALEKFSFSRLIQMIGVRVALAPSFSVGDRDYGGSVAF